MPAVQQTTTTSTVTKQWWSGLINLQTLIVVFGGFASLVLFWNTQKNHSNQIDVLIKEVKSKAEQSEVESINDKQTRQYEQIRSVLDRIIVVEKALEYERGKHDAMKETEKK